MEHRLDRWADVMKEKYRAARAHGASAQDAYTWATTFAAYRMVGYSVDKAESGAERAVASRKR